MRPRPLLLTFAFAAALASAAYAQGNIFEQGRQILRGSQSGGGGESSGEIGAGLKEALKVGTERVVGRVGRLDGFNADPDIHIPLPQTLSRAQQALRMAGASGLVDDLELRLNRAAEAAAPKAQSLFWSAIEQMTLDDARQILQGPKDSATQYFRGKMRTPLAQAMRPIVDDSLAEVGAIKSYDQFIGQYKQVPFMPDVKANLTDYVLEKASDGMFHYLAKEEAAIRTNPAARSTELLRKVFGG